MPHLYGVLNATFWGAISCLKWCSPRHPPDHPSIGVPLHSSKQTEYYNKKALKNYPYIHLLSKVWSPFPKKQMDPTKMIQLFLLTPRNSRKIRSASLTLLSATLSSFLRKHRGCVVGRGGNQRINWGTKIRYIIIVIQQFTRHCTVLNYCNFFLRISDFV